MFITLFFCVAAYLIGSINSAIILCKLLKLPDPRLTGSGNPGATNVLRLADKKVALAVLLFDGLKGFVPVLIAKFIGIYGLGLGLVAFAALLGHIFPVFFQFKGGKGVATFLGATLGISLGLGIIALLIWLAVAYIYKYSSLASLVSALITTLLAPWLLGSFGFFIPYVLMLLILAWRHQENIARLRAGIESKIGQKQSTTDN